MNPLHETLRCPETGQRLTLATPDLIERLQSRLKSGTLKTRAGATPEPFDAALVTLDGSRIYPIRDGIPVMLITEAF